MAFWGVADFLVHRSVRIIGSAATLLAIGLFGVIGLLPFVLADLPAIFNPASLALLIPLGFAMFFASLANFESLRKGKLSVTEVVIGMELPFVAILGFVFLGETLSTIRIALVLIVFAGITFVSLPSLRIKLASKKLEAGVAMGILAAIGLSITNLLTAQSSRAFSPAMAVWFPSLVVVLACTATILSKGGMREAKKIFAKSLRVPGLIFALGAFDVAAWACYSLSLSSSLLAITTAISVNYAVIAAILGLVFNKEKLARHQLAGAAIALSAGCLLSFA